MDLKKIEKSLFRIKHPSAGGVACVISLINYYDGETTLKKLFDQSGTNAEFSTVLGLCKALRSEGFTAGGYRGNMDYLKEAEAPVILHVAKNSGHEDFVVCYGFREDNKFIVGDPGWGVIEYQEGELDEIWKSKVFIQTEPGDGFKSGKEISSEKRRWIKGLFYSHRKVLVAVGMISFLFSVAALAVLFLALNAGSEARLHGQESQLYQSTILSEISVFRNSIIAALLIFVLLFSQHLISGLARRGVAVMKSDFIRSLSGSWMDPSSDVFKKPTGDFASVSMAYQKTAELLYSLFQFIPGLAMGLAVSMIILSIHSWFSLVFQAFSFAMIFYRANKKASLSVQQVQSEISWEMVRSEFSANVSATKKNMVLSFPNKSARDSVSGIFINQADSLKSKINQSLYSHHLFLFLAGILLYSTGVQYKFLTFSTSGLAGLFVFFLCTLIATFSLIRLYQLRYLVNYLYENIGGNSDGEETLSIYPPKLIPVASKFVADSLHYSFPGKINLIDGFSFTAEKNSLTAIIGGSGSGKSVLADILCRLKSPTSGRLLLDDKDSNTLPREQWRKLISVVFQQQALMNASISENLTTVAENQKEVLSICQELGFDLFIKRLPDDSATHWGQLSTGYRQMTAFLYAIIKKPAILILDEPFSSMDGEMEMFSKNLLQGLKNKMIIVILTSDKNLAEWADVVFQLKPGNK